MESFEIISFEELEEIRRIWIEEKCELEDSLPEIYERATGSQYPGGLEERYSTFSAEDFSELREICSSEEDPDDIHYSMLRQMLAIEQGYRGATRRVGIYDDLLKSLKQHAFLNRDQALEYKLATKDSSWINGDIEPLDFDENLSREVSAQGGM